MHNFKIYYIYILLLAKNYQITLKINFHFFFQNISSPKCRGEYAPSELPQRYFCFCGKVENPVYDIWTVPHSCGKTCDKRLKPECSHTCSLLCHPGMIFF